MKNNCGDTPGQITKTLVCFLVGVLFAVLILIAGILWNKTATLKTRVDMLERNYIALEDAYWGLPCACGVIIKYHDGDVWIKFPGNGKPAIVNAQ